MLVGYDDGRFKTVVLVVSSKRRRRSGMKVWIKAEKMRKKQQIRAHKDHDRRRFLRMTETLTMVGRLGRRWYRDGTVDDLDER